VASDVAATVATTDQRLHQINRRAAPSRSNDARNTMRLRYQRRASGRDVCRDGGMTELGDADGAGVMSLAMHKTSRAARLYVKWTSRGEAWRNAQSRQETEDEFCTSVRRNLLWDLSRPFARAATGKVSRS